MSGRIELIRKYWHLSRRLHGVVRRGHIRRDEFLREITTQLQGSISCDAVRIDLNEAGGWFCGELIQRIDCDLAFAYVTGEAESPIKSTPLVSLSWDLRRLRQKMLNGELEPSDPWISDAFSYWDPNTLEGKTLRYRRGKNARKGQFRVGGAFRSLLIIPLFLTDRAEGILQLGSSKEDFFKRDELVFLEDLARDVEHAVTERQIQWGLQERLACLTCLRRIADLCAQSNESRTVILQQLVDLLTEAWPFSNPIAIRLKFAGETFLSRDFRDSDACLSLTLASRGNQCGTIEVFKIGCEGPLAGSFSIEEEGLLQAVASRIGSTLERIEVFEESKEYQKQLWHADRLATIGQLAAGVAHELNEPLGAVLGFSQLALKNSDLAQSVVQDLERIETSALHAREIIAKLLTFARERTPVKEVIDLNAVVSNSLYLFESRCAKEGIALVRLLEDDLPQIVADPGQMQQVLMNLIVNAIQAMPGGGRLTIITSAGENEVFLKIEDTGVGMSDFVLGRAFLPFFTTKGVGQGTGLGLSVVHGIVTSHEGEIGVESKLGKGTSFKISFPAGSELE